MGLIYDALDMTGLDVLRTVAIVAVVWAAVSLLFGWGWSRWWRYQRAHDLETWRQRERLRWGS